MHISKIEQAIINRIKANYGSYTTSNPLELNIGVSERLMKHLTYCYYPTKVVIPMRNLEGVLVFIRPYSLYDY